MREYENALFLSGAVLFFLPSAGEKMFLILVSLLSIFPVDGYSMCINVRAPLGDRISDADMILVAKMIAPSVRAKDGPNGAARMAKMEVVRVLKGKMEKKFNLYFKVRTSEYSCDQNQFYVLANEGALSKSFLLFVKDVKGKYITSFEMGSEFAEISVARKEIDQISKMKFK